MQVQVSTDIKFIHTFDELSDSAKETARDWFKTGMHFDWGYDYAASLKGFCDFFPAECREWEVSLCSYSHIKIESTESDDINELTGVRLWKWLNNNGCFDAKILSGNCPFTGYCGDEALLDPIRQFRDLPGANITLPELLQDCGESWLKTYIADWEYQYSNESVDENITANEYEFNENGNLV